MNKSGNTNHTTSLELKPCPFCQGDEISHGYNDPPPAPGCYGIVQCHACDIFMLGEDEADAIAAWNTRQPQFPSTGLSGEELIELLELGGDYAADVFNSFHDKTSPCALRVGENLRRFNKAHVALSAIRNGDEGVGS